MFVINDPVPFLPCLPGPAYLFSVAPQDHDGRRPYKLKNLHDAGWYKQITEPDREFGCWCEKEGDHVIGMDQDASCELRGNSSLEPAEALFSPNVEHDTLLRRRASNADTPRSLCSAKNTDHTKRRTTQSESTWIH